MTEKFNFEQALEALKAGQPITGKDSVLSPLIKRLTEAALEAEIDTHLAQEITANRKNGKSRKTMKRKFETPTTYPERINQHITDFRLGIRQIVRNLTGVPRI